MKSQNEIVDGVSEKVQWWVERRRKKLIELDSTSYAFNPFLWPIVNTMHGFEDARTLAAFQLAHHVSVGHATGFGKLVDEKILSDVFGTQKLSSGFRKQHPELLNSCYDDIDHLVPNDKGTFNLLSVKASRWSIQLGQAVNLNRSFQTLLERREQKQASFDRIVVGVFYGDQDGLTDKYEVLRGLGTGASHDIVDVSEHVDVVSGREFWSWINGGEPETQEWVLKGIEDGYRREVQKNGPLDQLFEKYISAFVSEHLEPFMDSNGTIDWVRLLNGING